MRTTQLALAAGLIVALSMSSAHAAKPAAKPAAKKPAAAAKPAPAPPKPVAPQPYPGGTSLPAGYTGVDLKGLYALLKASSEDLKKGEYETSEEFARRKAAASVQGIDPNAEYAFLPDSIRVEYNADSQNYKASSIIFCEAAYDTGEFKGWTVCNGGDVEMFRDTYEGTNGYGAKAVIDRTRGRELGMAFRSDDPVLRSQFFAREKYSSWTEFQDVFQMPLERARGFAGKDIKVLLVGRIKQPLLIEGRGLLGEPTIAKPRDIFIQKLGVPFELKRVVYFVQQTGEVIRDKAL